MKRFISVLLLAATALSFASCSGTSDDLPADTSSLSEETAATPETEPPIVYPVDACDYDGAVFNVLAPKWGMYEKYFFADAQTGETVNDAIYERELFVENHLGISYTYKLDGTISDVRPILQQSSMAGDEPYQLILTHCMKDIGTIATENLLYDWKKLPGVHLDSEYWNQSSNINHTIAGKQFYAISDYMIADPCAFLFNVGFIKDFKLDNPYDLVRSGKWTLDKMIEMGQTVTNDLDGNGTMDLKDRYGISAHNNWMWSSFLYSSEISMVAIEEDGSMKLTLNNERTIRLIEKLHKLINGSDDIYIFDYKAQAENQLRVDSGRVLFHMEALNAMDNYRETEVEYGILPFPKFDEAQSRYYSLDWSGLMCVPHIVKNPEMIGKTCEMLAYISGETTIPAYYDKLLGNKLARDKDSQEMLNIIFDNIVYDAGMNYFGLDWQSGFQSLFYTLSNLVVVNKSADFASFYASNATKAQAAIDDFHKNVSQK